MGVPENVRKITRPKNTIVYTIRDGVYGVRERAGTNYAPGGKVRPINGKVVGHIIDNKFIPIVEPVLNIPMFLSYGSSALIKKFSNDIYEDLLKIYPINETKEIMSIASLKVIKPSIKCSRYSNEYERTYISIYYPDCHLSKNSINSLLSRIGMDSEKREKFYQSRLSRTPESHQIAIDGTLKQDNSTVNSLSGYSYKSRLKNTKDISIIYAYDINTKEPLCSTVFPGNNLDVVSYRQFVKENSIKNGIIVTDKGFPISEIEDIISSNKGLHFLTPLRRNDKRIINNNMFQYEETINGIEKEILGKKIKINENRYLYSFFDVATMSKETHDFIKSANKNNDFDAKKFEKKRNAFGTITLESDLDMSLKDAYLCYAERWKLELVFKAYKNDIGLCETNVQSDYSVIGMEFINFISTIITTRIIELFRGKDLFRKNTYGEIMDDLTSAWRKREKDLNKPSCSDGKWVNTLPSALDLMKLLELLKEEMPKEKRGRGRPKKSISS